MHRRLYGVSVTMLVGALVAITLLSPFQVTAQSVDDGAPVTIAQEPTVEPTPTEIPPTETPTPEPTATDTPTPAPTATEVPATATPTQVPATDTPAPAPTNTPTPMATATPTATATAKSPKPSLLASGPTAAAVSVCLLASPTNSVGPEPYVIYTCTSSSTPFKIGAANLTGNWEWGYNFGAITTSITWRQTASPGNDASGSDATVNIYLRPLSGAANGSTGSIDITLKPNQGADSGPFTLAAIKQAAPSPTYQMTCSPTLVTAAPTQSGTSACTLSATNLPPSTTVTVDSITIPAVNGWTLSASPSSGSLTSSTPFAFTVSLSPGCGASDNPATGNVQVLSSLTSGTTFAGPSASITAKRDTNTTLTASITNSNITWSRVYSFSPQSVSGSLSYQVTGNGCAGWNIQVSASNFNYSGSAAGTAIPNGNASLTPGAPSAVTGSLTGLTAGSGGALSTSQKVLSASASNGLGTYNQSLAVGVTIPGGARVGAYTSTITITAAAGP